MFLVGSNVKLHIFESKHITDDYLNWVNDQKINKYITMGRIPVDKDQIFVPDPYETLLFAILTMDNEYIGNASIHNIDWITQKAEIGYVLGHKKYWNKGWATEIVALLVDYAFNRLNIQKLHADVVDGNIASVNVLLKNGFTQYAVNPRDFYLCDETLNNCLFYKLNK